MPARVVEAPPTPGVGVLVATKLRPPAPAREALPRPELLARLRDGGQRRLTLVSAPAGWGKTTALAAWAADDDRPFAWLSLDADDDTPTRFLTYLTAAIRERVHGFGDDVLAALAAQGPHAGRAALAEAVLPRLLNALARVETGLVVVVDDVHLLAHRDVHAALDLLAERLPPGVHLALSGREDPPLRLARRRVRGELAEVRADVLGFRVEETRAVLAEVGGYPVAAADVARVQARTEGWPAGVRLTALSRRGGDGHARGGPPGGPPGSPPGGPPDVHERHVADFLSDEVLAGLAPARRRFLLRTSVLDELTGPACDAVTGGSGSLEALRDLERASLFVVAVDERRERFRHHALFADLLRRELAREEPDAVADLHARACRWATAQGEVARAVGHALAAGELDRAAELLAEGWSGLADRGHRAALTGWLEALPEARRRGDPRLCLATAELARRDGRLAEVEPWLDATTRARAADAVADGGALDAAVAGVRAAHRLAVGDVGGAVLAGRAALPPPEATAGRPAAATALGLALCWRGEPDEARALLSAAATDAEGTGAHVRGVLAEGGLASIAADEGDEDVAALHARRAVDLAAAHGLGTDPALALAHVALARALVATDAAAARVAARAGLRLARRGREALPTVLAIAVLVRSGDAARRDLLAEARAVLATCRDPGRVAALLEAARPGRAQPAGSVCAAPRPPTGEPLTAREVDVLRLLRTDLTQREIARRLSVSRNTVKAHTSAIYRKLAVRSRRDAVERARHRSLL